MQVPGLCLVWQGPGWGAAIAGTGRRWVGSGVTRRAAGERGAAQLSRAAAAVQAAPARAAIGEGLQRQERIAA